MARTRIRHKDVRLHLPATPGTPKDEELFNGKGRYFEANCLGTDALGDFVYITADEAANLFNVTKVDVDDSTTMPAIGVIIEKPTLSTCLVMTFGVLAATGLTPNARYWVDTDAQITATPPTRASGVNRVVQVVGIALSSTKLLLRPDYLAIKLAALP